LGRIAVAFPANLFLQYNFFVPGYSNSIELLLRHIPIAIGILL
jgi:hypothetical protein